MILETIPYFYIIRYKKQNKLYAGARWIKGCNPKELLIENGYLTSSNKIKNIIKNEGLNAFEIFNIEINFNGLHVYDFETEFLIKNDCAHNSLWLNGHNNTLFSLGTPEYTMYMLKNYNVPHTSLSKEITDKIKQTNITKYGTPYIMGSDYFKSKTAETINSKYNVDYISQVPEIKEKKRKTNLNKYGTECNLNTNEGIIQKKQTWLKNYGVDNPSKSIDIKIKKTNTLLRNYGVDHPMKIPHVIEKFKEIGKEIRKHDPILTCPHCGLTAKGKGVMNRWHFDNCKNKLSICE